MPARPTRRRSPHLAHHTSHEHSMLVILQQLTARPSSLVDQSTVLCMVMLISASFASRDESMLATTAARSGSEML